MNLTKDKLMDKLLKHSNVFPVIKRLALNVVRRLALLLLLIEPQSLCLSPVLQLDFRPHQYFLVVLTVAV